VAFIGSVIEMEFNELWFSPLGQFVKGVPFLTLHFHSYDRLSIIYGITDNINKIIHVHLQRLYSN
jgi:hypothetical protein